MLYRMFRKILCARSSPIEVATALQAILWGAWLTLPLDTFPSSSAYVMMGSVAPEYIWGGVLVVIGAIQLVAVHIKRHALRQAVASLVLFMWMFIDIGFWLSRSASGASVTYLVYVLLSMWSVASLSIKGKVDCGN